MDCISLPNISRDVETRESFSTISDEQVFELAAARLRKLSKKRAGSELLYGVFEFVFHDGKLEKIEERRRSRIYLRSQ